MSQIEDARIVQEPTANDMALVSAIQAIVPQKNYGYETAVSIAEACVRSSNSDDINKIEALAMLACLSEAFDRAKKAIAQELAQEANEWPEKSFTAFNVSLTKKETGVSYLYEEDDSWREIVAKIDERNAAYQHSIKDLVATKKGKEAELKAAGTVTKISTTTVVTKLL